MNQERELEKPIEPLPPENDSSALPVDDVPAPSFSARAKRSKSGSPWPMLIAVVLGGGVAVGIVKMIPDSWLPRKENQAEPSNANGQSAENPGDTDADPNDVRSNGNDANELATANLPATPPRRTVAQTPDDPAVQLARKREDEAASLLKRAKMLLKIGRPEEAERLIEQILNRYDDTITAVEAENVLRTISRR